jgi:hypothetical protein
VPRVDPDHTTTVGLDRDQARALMVAADTGTSFVVVLAPYQAGWLAAACGLHGEIADKGDKAPIQAGQRLARRTDQRLAQRSTGCNAATSDEKPCRHDHHRT